MLPAILSKVQNLNNAEYFRILTIIFISTNDHSLPDCSLDLCNLILGTTFVSNLELFCTVSTFDLKPKSMFVHGNVMQEKGYILL